MHGNTGIGGALGEARAAWAAKFPERGVDVFVLGSDVSPKKGGKIANLAQGGQLSAQNIADVEDGLGDDRGAGFEVRGQRRGVAVLSTNNAISDKTADEEDRTEFGAALTDHEIGHALGLDDNPKRDKRGRPVKRNMMTHDIGTADQQKQRKVRKADRKKVREELDRRAQ